MKLIPWQRTELLDVCNHADDYYSSHIVSYIGCTDWEYNFSVILPFGLDSSLCILGTAYNVSSKQGMQLRLARMMQEKGHSNIIFCDTKYERKNDWKELSPNKICIKIFSKNFF